jgi:hypothetical protein
MSTSAYLVAWKDRTSGKIRDAAIYSEPNPGTILDESPVLVAKAISRYAGSEGWQRASQELVHMVEKSPRLAWVRTMPTFKRRYVSAAYRKPRRTNRRRRRR